MSPRVDWFFGRGLSIGCGLPWSVPPDWSNLHREEKILQIKAALSAEMDASHVDTTTIHMFLNTLATRTVKPWQHQFYTTNWDYLLQREIGRLELTVLPDWCAGTHVYHLNGTVEILPENARRSAFVLESDFADARTSTHEGNVAFEKLIWNQSFVVVGMSFECAVDKFLLASLQKVEDDLPIGESRWILVNPDAQALAVAASQFRKALPHADVLEVPLSFDMWLEAGLPELQEFGAITFQNSVE